MKDSLKDFIHENRQAFDDLEPSDSIWNRVKASLPDMKQRTLWNSLVVWRSAAVLLLGLSVYLFLIRMPSKIQRNEMAKSQIEFTDLESFYSNQIAEKVALINDFDGSSEDDRFTRDFQRLEAMYQVLREEMKAHPSEKVKDALVLNLLVRIDLLNQLIKRLEDARKPVLKSKSAIV